MREHGTSAPAHRWTVTVLVLVTLASLPTLAAISAGTATLGQTAEPDGTTPFIARPDGVPVVIVPAPPAVLPPRPPVAGPVRPPRRSAHTGHRRRGDQVRRGTGRTGDGAPPAPPAPAAPAPAPPPVVAGGTPNGNGGTPDGLGWRPLSAPRPGRAGVR